MYSWDMLLFGLVVGVECRKGGSGDGAAREEGVQQVDGVDFGFGKGSHGGYQVVNPRMGFQLGKVVHVNAPGLRNATEIISFQVHDHGEFRAILQNNGGEDFFEFRGDFDRQAKLASGE